MKKSQLGVTLLEMMLVLTLIAGFTALSLRLYDSYKRDQNVNQIRADVDRLAYAAAQYYRSECAAGGVLDPLTNNALDKKVVPLDIKNDLIDNDFLGKDFPVANNPLVKDSGSGHHGYAVQLNREDRIRYADFCQDPTCSSTVSRQIGTIIIWTIQVSVRMSQTSSAELKAMQGLLAADCLTNVTGSPAQADLCNTDPSGNYLTFERLPRMPTSDLDSASPYWQSMPIADQFALEQSTDDINTLANMDHTPETKYFYCSS